MSGSVPIPVWAEYAQELEKTGIDGLELNFYATPDNLDKDEETIIEAQLAILKKVKSKVGITVIVKISPFYANLLKVISEMDKAGADSIVLFNKLFQPDINIDTEEEFTIEPKDDAPFAA